MEAKKVASDVASAKKSSDAQRTAEDTAFHKQMDALKASGNACFNEGNIRALTCTAPAS